MTFLGGVLGVAGMFKGYYFGIYGMYPFYFNKIVLSGLYEAYIHLGE